MKKEMIFTIVLLLIVLSTVGTAVAVKEKTTVQVLDPTKASNGAKGLVSGGHWVGEVPIIITSGGVSAKTLSYCMDYQGTLNIGGTYTANFASVTDTQQWRAISYVLTWNEAFDDKSAAINQVAIWKLRDGSFTAKDYDQEIGNGGLTLAEEANGKDVVRPTDRLDWISPITGNMSGLRADAGQIITFEARLTSQSGVPRSHVRMLFSAVLNFEGSSIQLNSTYVDPVVAYTDGDGIASVNITVPTDTAMGATIEVKASTRCHWPHLYVDVSGKDNQDLLVDDEVFELSSHCNLFILAYITVLPESELGALSAIAAFVAAFLLMRKTKKLRMPKLSFH